MTPNPRFIFWSGQHEAATESLLYGIQARKGFLLLTGEIGTGKTTLCREILGRLEPTTAVSVILNPLLSVPKLLKAINDDFGINQLKSGEDQLSRLRQFLLERAQEKHNAVLFVDEAQTMSEEALEAVRLLSNLETDDAKLLQIVLVGQPELEELLQSYRLRQLNQRISVRRKLGVLPYQELTAYIHHRMTIAGNRGKVHFDKGALKLIYQQTAGFPRLVNMLCDRVLLAAYAKRSWIINKKLVKEGIEDLGLSLKPPWWRVW